jgi:hypothetical protein
MVNRSSIRGTYGGHWPCDKTLTAKLVGSLPVDMRNSWYFLFILKTVGWSC